MSKRTLVLFNPRARRLRATAAAQHLVRLLSSAGFSCDLQIVGEEAERTIPRLDGRDLVVVCGGDGTFHRLIPHLAGAGIPVGLIPAGTANVLARELGIPPRMEAAVEILRSGKTREMCLAESNGEMFHLMAGVGFDGYLVSRFSPSLKSFLGIAAFWLAGATRFWSYPLPVFSVVTEQGSLSGTMAVVSNGRYYGRQLLMAPGASVFEPNLDLCIFQSQNHVRYLAYLWATLWGRHVGMKDVVHKKVSNLAMRSEVPVYVQLDGEPAGRLPISIERADKRIPLVVP